MNLPPLENLLFLDIETVRSHKQYDELDERLQKQWEKKAKRIDEEQSPEAVFNERAGIFAEFGKIVCISVGYFSNTLEGKVLRITTVSDHDEKELLIKFADLLNKFDQNRVVLVGHNGKEFDFPYICRRMIIQGVPLPECLQIWGKKPWEIRHMDTLEMWKFGDFKNYTALELLAASLGVPTPKDDIDGSQVGTVYYDEDDLERICKYCEKDVAVTARVYLRLIGLDDLEENQIKFV